MPMAASLPGFKALIENGPDAISLIDADGEILYGSASMTRLFGYQPEELLGRNCLELINGLRLYRGKWSGSSACAPFIYAAGKGLLLFLGDIAQCVASQTGDEHLGNSRLSF